MSYNDLETRIKAIKGNAEESYADYPTRQRAATTIANEVNQFIPNSYNQPCEELEKEGIVSLGKLLTSKQINDIHEWFQYKKVYNSHVPKGDGILRYLHESPSPYNCYDPKDIIACPHLLNTALNEKVISLAASYLGCLPTLYSMNCFWTDSGTNQGVQSWHRDLDDFKFLTLLVYLVDVDETTGPHVFVRCTHDKSIMEQVAGQDMTRFFPPNPFPYPAFEYMFPGKVDVLTGEAGSGYLLDTFGIHRGSSNIQKKRFILWLRYGITAAPPSLVQIPKPFSVNELNINFNFDNYNKYITRVLLDHAETETANDLRCC